MKALWFCYIFSFSFSAWAYQVEDVQFSAGENSKLSAHLYFQKPSKIKRPAILILEGTGRNISAVPYHQLAEKLADLGYLVMTFSRRGYGHNSVNESKWHATFTSQVQDSQYALNYLKTHPQVEPKKVFIIGHCLGGAQALKLTEQNELAGLLLVTSTLRSISDVQMEERRTMGQLKGWSKKKIDESLQTLAKQIHDVKAGTYKCVAPECKVIDGVEVVTDSVAIPWWQEALKLDITEWALKSKAPVYFIFGGSDFVSTKTDYYYVRDVIRINKTHHLDSRFLPNLDHFMVENKSIEESFKYSENLLNLKNSKPISNDLVNEIAAWIRQKSQDRLISKRTSLKPKSESASF